jgi:hypothetical protein
VRVPGAASRVFDELTALALDPAPGTQARWCRLTKPTPL